MLPVYAVELYTQKSASYSSFKFSSVIVEYCNKGTQSSWSNRQHTSTGLKLPSGNARIPHTWAHLTCFICQCQSRRREKSSWCWDRDLCGFESLILSHHCLVLWEDCEVQCNDILDSQSFYSVTSRKRKRTTFGNVYLTKNQTNTTLAWPFPGVSQKMTKLGSLGHMIGDLGYDASRCLRNLNHILDFFEFGTCVELSTLVV